jgi:hypothetical protein
MANINNSLICYSSEGKIYSVVIAHIVKTTYNELTNNVEILLTDGSIISINTSNEILHENIINSINKFYSQLKTKN